MARLSEFRIDGRGCGEEEQEAKEGVMSVAHRESTDDTRIVVVHVISEAWQYQGVTQVQLQS